MDTRGSRLSTQYGVSSDGDVRSIGYGERVGDESNMDVGVWLGSTAAIIVMLVVSVITLVAFVFWIKQVQFGATGSFVAAVMPASMINVMVALAFLLVTPGGLCEKDEMRWFLVTPLAVYGIVSLALCIVLLVVGDARFRTCEHVDSLTISGTLTAYYAFLLILYPVACCLYAFMLPLPL